MLGEAVESVKTWPRGSRQALSSEAAREAR